MTRTFPAFGFSKESSASVMAVRHPIATFAAIALVSVGGVTGQLEDSPRPDAGAPQFVVLVYQRFRFDKAAESGRALAGAARVAAKLEVPNSWIVSESVTGEPEVLSFDPFDSFAHLDKAFAEWGRIYAAHPELGKWQAQINGALASQRTIVAVRRDDLSYRANRVDLSKARFLRILEVRLNPGHEAEFAEAFEQLSRAYEKINSDLPWVVYQENVGMPGPAFFAFVPMRTMAQNDDLLNLRVRLREADGQAAERMEQIARAAYLQLESNLYAISPEKSHVSKEFAAGDADFWTPKPLLPPKPTDDKRGRKKPE